MAHKIIRIGTRDSELALWQAHTVEKKLQSLGYKTKIVAVKSDGDIILNKPLYELGITGIFTKTLDIAMLNNQVDIVVHSMKDVPTSLPNGIIQAAVLERASTLDVLVYKENIDFLNSNGIIATGSLRRKAQWLHRYPMHQVEDLRGNVNTRMQKLKNSNWNGAIFAAAGLERIDLKPDTYLNLDWMIPAPAQGTMVVVAKENDLYATQAVSQLNHKETEICTHIERQFLKTLEGGCTAPIGALATINNRQINFCGALFSLNGKEKYSIEKTCNLDNYLNFGQACAIELLNDGAKLLMKKMKQHLNPQ
ncbi:MAG TPA: hydroxymethylbilane synthase [Flavobacterium sp.]|nr:hydroxymethylbilane synthase [Flavobacterium sp.]